MLVVVFEGAYLEETKTLALEFTAWFELLWLVAELIPKY